jgi:hypothetical protein
MVHCDTVMQCDTMPHQHPEGTISECPQYCHDILYNGPFILSCKESAVHTILSILMPCECEFTYSVGMLELLFCRVPKFLTIHNWKYWNVDFGFLAVNELLWTTRCQHNYNNTQSLLYEGQFQDFQNIMKYVLSQWYLLNLVSWQTPYWIKHCLVFKLCDSSQCL